MTIPTHCRFDDWATLRGRLGLRIVGEVARMLIPQDYDSMNDLVQKTNRNLARLGLPAISLEKTLVETFDVESSPEITLPTF